MIVAQFLIQKCLLSSCFPLYCTPSLPFSALDFGLTLACLCVVCTSLLSLRSAVEVERVKEKFSLSSTKSCYTSVISYRVQCMYRTLIPKELFALCFCEWREKEASFFLEYSTCGMFNAVTLEWIEEWALCTSGGCIRRKEESASKILKMLSVWSIGLLLFFERWAYDKQVRNAMQNVENRSLHIWTYVIVVTVVLSWLALSFLNNQKVQFLK